MAKETYLKFRCTDKFKRTVETQAGKYGMSTTSYIERLIRKDIDNMKIIYAGNLTEEMENAFKNETTCFLSSKEHAWLFIDMDVFNDIDGRFQFEIETEDKDFIYPRNIEEYLECEYEEDYLNYLGSNLHLSDYAEITAEMVEDLEGELCNNNWDETLDRWIKTQAMTGIMIHVEKTLQKMINDGYDISQLFGLAERVNTEMKMENKEVSE